MKTSNNSRKIGLCWHTKQFSPLHPDRSFLLEDMRVLSILTNNVLISFQNGYGSEQILYCSFRQRFIDCQDEVSQKRDFPNTIAAINQCDYFVTCDTGIAQISCALGIKTIVITLDKPSAQWSGEGVRSFFYKNAYIHRKAFQESWKESIDRLFNSTDIESLFHDL